MKLFRTVFLSLLMLPLLAQAALAADFREGVHYRVLHQGPVTKQPEITEYFSLACPHCRQFEPIVTNLLAEKPQNVNFNRVHVEFVGGRTLGPELARGWAIAELLKVTDQVKYPLYTAVQEKRSIRDADDVRDLFIAQGIDAAKYDGAAGSFMLNGRVAQMRKLTQDKQIQGVPAFVVHGKYLVLTQELRSAQELNELVLWLATEKY